MRSLRTRPLASFALYVAATAGATLAALWPRPTYAEEIPDSERWGVSEEEGTRFGSIIVRGELVAADSAPGGWTLVRTLENKSDEPETCVVEERVMRTETMPEARVTPPPVAVVLRHPPIALGPHEKRTIGVRLPPGVGEQISAGKKTEARIQRDFERAVAAERWDNPALGRTYMAFHVEYLKPLPPGATAERPDHSVTRPERLPF